MLITKVRLVELHKIVRLQNQTLRLLSDRKSGPTDNSFDTLRPLAQSKASRSAAAFFAKSDGIRTVQDSSKQKQRLVELDDVRSKLNELDQRKVRHQQYYQMLRKIGQRAAQADEFIPLPFKHPTESKCDAMKELRECSSWEEVLQITEDPAQLAHELLKVAMDLKSAQRKLDNVMEDYMELKKQALLTRNK